MEVVEDVVRIEKAGSYLVHSFEGCTVYEEIVEAVEVFVAHSSLSILYAAHHTDDAILRLVNWLIRPLKENNGRRLRCRCARVKLEL